MDGQDGKFIGNSQLRPRDKAQRPWATADHPGCTRLQALISNPNSIETVGNHPSQGVPGLSIRGHTDFFKVGQVHDFNLRIFVFRKLWSKTSQEQTANCCLPQTSRIWDVLYQFGEVIPFWGRDYWMVFSWQDSRALGQNATYEPTSTYFLNHLPCTFLVFLNFGPLRSLPLAKWAVSICVLDKLRLRPFFSIQTLRILRIPQIPRPSHLAGQSCLTRNRCKNTLHGIMASVYREFLSISALGLHVFLQSNEGTQIDILYIVYDIDTY